MLAEQLRKSITAREAACVIEQLLQDGMQFCRPQSRIGLAVFPGLLYDDGFYCILCKAILVVTLVVCLSAVTKQPAKGAQGCPRAPFAKQTYCLVPNFFLTGMLKVCSARSIMVE